MPRLDVGAFESAVDAPFEARCDWGLLAVRVLAVSNHPARRWRCAVVFALDSGAVFLALGHEVLGQLPRCAGGRSTIGGARVPTGGVRSI